jgi:hypothetical protein
MDVSPVLVDESLISTDFYKRMEWTALPGYVRKSVAANCETGKIAFTKSFGVFA